MTDSDAFARLKTRTRATVPVRNISLTETNNDQKTDFSHSVKDEVSQRRKSLLFETLREREGFANDSEGTSELCASRQDKINNFSNEVTRRTLRIDRDLDEDLERLCAKAKITRETFLEAAYLACTLESDLMESVLARAQQRYRQRKQTGEQRKFETMKGKYAGTPPEQPI